MHLLHQRVQIVLDLEKRHSENGGLEILLSTDISQPVASVLRIIQLREWKYVCTIFYNVGYLVIDNYYFEDRLLYSSSEFVNLIELDGETSP